jgi:antitoxin HicB
MVGYWFTLEPDDNDTLLVRCPQLPIVVTYGEDKKVASRHALDAIETALASMIDDGEEIPREAGKGDVFVPLSLQAALKLSLYWAVRDAGISRAELARRLGWNRESVDRLFRLSHASRIAQIDAAFAALGRAVDVRIGKAA